LTDVSEPFLCIVAPIGSKRAGDCRRNVYSGRVEHNPMWLRSAGVVGRGTSFQQRLVPTATTRLTDSVIFPLSGCLAPTPASSKVDFGMVGCLYFTISEHNEPKSAQIWKFYCLNGVFTSKSMSVDCIFATKHIPVMFKTVQKCFPNV